jgi:hypothetical protein
VEHGGLNDITKHSVTESTELNPCCQQPFLFDKMSSSPKTPAAKKSAAKKTVKSQKKLPEDNGKRLYRVWVD